MKYWQCRESLYYNNTDPSDGIKISDFDTANEAREMFDTIVAVYASNDEYSLVINNGYTAIFECPVAGALVIITWYCVGYNGTRETLHEGDILDESREKEDT